MEPRIILYIAHALCTKMPFHNWKIIIKKIKIIDIIFTSKDYNITIESHEYLSLIPTHSTGLKESMLKKSIERKVLSMY